MEIKTSLQEFISSLNENKEDGFKTITIIARDQENELVDLLEYIKNNGNTGHSFSIIVDPDGDKTQKKEFFWDGDGSDFIKSIKVDENTKIYNS